MIHLMEENEKYREADISFDFLIFVPPHSSDGIIDMYHHAQFLFYFLDLFLMCEYLHMVLWKGTLCMPGAVEARKGQVVP